MTGQPVMPDPVRTVRKSAGIARACGARDSYSAAVAVYAIAVEVMCRDAETAGHVSPWLKAVVDAARQAADDAKPPPLNTVRGVLARMGFTPRPAADSNAQ